MWCSKSPDSGSGGFDDISNVPVEEWDTVLVGAHHYTIFVGCDNRFAKSI